MKNYRKTAIQPMRPYISGEDTTGWSISEKDTLEVGGMVAHDDAGSQWYVSEEFFKKNYELCVDHPVKTLHNSEVSGARKNVKDIHIVGNGDSFRLLCKASSEKEGWMKSTKAMDVQSGCVVQVSTQQRNPDGSYVVAEALTFVPGAVIVDDCNNGRKLVI